MNSEIYYSFCVSEWRETEKDWFLNVVMHPKHGQCGDSHAVLKAEGRLTPNKIVVFKIGNGRGSNWTVKPEAIKEFKGRPGNPEPRDYKTLEAVEYSILKNACRDADIEYLNILLSRQFVVAPYPDLLHFAVSASENRVAEFLLSHGLNTRSVYRGELPIYKAGTREMVELLIRHGADVQSPDDSGDTLMHHFMRKIPPLIKTEEALLFVRYLVEEKGLSPAARNNKNQTPSEYCREYFDCLTSSKIAIAKGIISYLSGIR